MNKGELCLNALVTLFLFLTGFIVACERQASPIPPQFKLHDLMIVPQEVTPGQEVIITVEVTNTGGAIGTCPVGLAMFEGGQTQFVEVTPGETKQVLFRIAPREPGEHDIDVDGLQGSFYVIKPEETGTPPTVPKLSFTTYRNAQFGYSINYPDNWILVGGRETKIESPDPYSCSIIIDVQYLPSRAAAQLLIDTLREAEQHKNMKHKILAYIIGHGAWDWDVSFQDVSFQYDLPDNIGHGAWDWDVSFQYDLPDYDEEWKGEIYFKLRNKSLYKISVLSKKAHYDTCPFKEIVSSFERIEE
jgi:hypothetical protein